MSKQKLWVKKRTSRGSGRAVHNRERTTVHNIDRDIRKNQLVYSHYLLKFVIIFALGLLWVRSAVGALGYSYRPIYCLANWLSHRIANYSHGEDSSLAAFGAIPTCLVMHTQLLSTNRFGVVILHRM